MRKLDSLRAILWPFSSSRRTLFQRFATLFYLTYVLDSGSIQLFKFRPSLALTSVRTPFEQPISLSLRRFSFWRYSLCISIEGLAPRQQPGSTVMPWGFRASPSSQTQKPPSFERDTKPRVAWCKIGKRGVHRGLPKLQDLGSSSLRGNTLLSIADIYHSLWRVYLNGE